MILVTAPVWNTYLIIGFNPEIVEPFFLNGNMKCSQDDNTFFADRWPRKWVEQAILATRYGIYGVKKNLTLVMSIVYRPSMITLIIGLTDF